MDNTIRIGMLIGRFYPVEGGAEIQCRRLSRELLSRKHSVFVLTQALASAPDHESIDNIPVYRVGLPLSGKIGSLSLLLRGFFWLITHSNKFELLHVHMASSPAVLAILFKLIRKKPVIVKVAGSRKTGDMQTSSATWYGKRKLSFLIKHVDCFVCPSGEIREELLAAGVPAHKVVHIPNGVDTSEFAPAGAEKAGLRRELGLPLAVPIAIYCGRLQEGKGLDILLRAWEMVVDSYHTVKPLLLIVGDGPIAQRLKKDYGHLETVRFRGWSNETSDFFRASDIFTLPSFGEGLPNALIEAMSCGLPCIATNIGGVSDVLVDGFTGVIIEPGNAPLLAKNICELLNDRGKAEKLGTRARQFVEQNISMSLITARYESLYHSLLDNKGTSILL